MLKLKFSPLILFIILLVVLIFSTIICKTCFLNSSYEKEGFVSYQQDKNTTLNPNTMYNVNLPQYSSKNTVTKLYDNLFFDVLNGNVIEVDSLQYSAAGNVSGNVSGNVDTTGSSISNIYITTRSNANMSYATSKINGVVQAKDVSESLSNTVVSSFNHWSYVTTATTTDKYQLLYFPWGDSTYIHIIKLKSYQSTAFTPSHITSILFGPGKSMSSKSYTDGAGSFQTGAGLSIKNPENDPSTDKYVYDDYYDVNKSVYQLSKYVKFDRSNANLLIRTDAGITVRGRNGSVTVYNSKGQIRNTSNTIDNSDFRPFIEKESEQFFILYLPISTKTMIVLLKLDPSDSTRFKIEKVVRFNKDGIETDAGTMTNSGVTPTTFDLNEFYTKYWLTFSNSGNPYISEDYLLKTQIVPPVCPSCPSCAYSAGTCTNCGGAGGSGTLSGDGTTLVKNNATGSAIISSGGAVVTGTTGSDKPLSNAVSQTANTLNTAIGSGSVLGSKTLDTTSDILKSTGSGAVDVLKSGSSGAADLLKSTGSGASDLLKSGASGATNLLKSTATGATDLLKSAGTGLKEIATDNRNAASNSQNTRGTGAISGTGAIAGTGISTRGVNGIDNYSYYGALPSKGGNYIPVTADFSAFAK